MMKVKTIPMNTTATTDSKKTFWGYGIYGLYGGFVLFVLGMVAFVSTQNINLVEPEYYRKGVAYQGQIDRLERTSQLTERLRVAFVAGSRQIRLTFPAVATDDTEPITGDITLYRPSNAGYDRIVKIAADQDHEQYIDASTLIPGMWRIKINWAVGESEYYTEQMLVIN